MSENNRLIHIDSDVAQTQPLMQASGIDVSIGEKKILQQMSFAIFKTERIAIIGQNGAGKSTLLQVLCALLKPDAGDLRWQGRALNAMTRRELAQKIAVLPQREDLPPELRVIDLVLMGRAPYRRGLGLASAEEQDMALEILNDLDLQHFALRRVGGLSGGERQRVLIARALLQQPELLLLDEPAASLDLGHALYIAHLSEKLARQGVTVLSVLHDLNLVARFAERVWVLRQGQLVLDAPVDQALQAERMGPLLDVDLLAGRLGKWPVLLPR